MFVPFNIVYRGSVELEYININNIVRYKVIKLGDKRYFNEYLIWLSGCSSPLKVLQQDIDYLERVMNNE